MTRFGTAPRGVAILAGMACWAIACRPPPELVPGEEIVAEIAPGETHVYALELEADRFVEVLVEQIGVDVETTLLDPDGEPVITADRAVEYAGPEPLVATSERAGRHALEVHAFARDDRPAGRYRIALRVVRAASETDRLRARAARRLARAAGQWGDEDALRAAVAELEATLALWERTGDVFWQAETLGRLADKTLALGERERAIALFERSAAVFAAAGDSVMQASALGAAGSVRYAAGEIEAAIADHRRALRLQTAAGDRLGQAISHNNLGQSYRARGRMQQALDAYARALALWDPERDRQRRAQTLHDLGVLYRILGRTDEAGDFLAEAERRWRELGADRSRAVSHNELGRLRQQLDDPEGALAHYETALALRRRSADRRGEALTLANVGLALQTLERPGEALAAYREALAVLEALDRPRPRAEAKVLRALGSLSDARGEPDAAVGFLTRALALSREIGDPAGEAESLRGLAVAETRRGRLDAARERARAAVALVEAVRLSAVSPQVRASFFSTVQPFFETLIEVLMASHRARPDAGFDAEALAASERARARSLAEMLVEAGADVRRGVDPALLRRERALQSELNAVALRQLRVFELETPPRGRGEDLEAELRTLAAGLDEVRADIRARSPRYAALVRSEPLGLDQIRRRVLDPDTLLLEYQVGAARSFAWLVAPDSLMSFELPARAEIEALTTRVYQRMKDGRPPADPAAATGELCALSRMLLGPVAEQLSDQRLVIVADEVLEYLPFAALRRATSRPECAAAPPLVAHHEIVHLPSASVLAVLRAEVADRAPAPGTVAVLADPVFSPADERVAASARATPAPAAARERFARLRSSRREAEEILSLVPADRGLGVLGFDASKETVRGGVLAGYRIVHFATHGILDTERPELSGLALTMVDERGARRPEDGFLFAHELYNLKLPAELVVLSACDTALGTAVRGEGLVGLARGFMYAGAPRVVVSLWPVGDYSTRRLMIELYRGLLERGLAPAAALRAAQLAMWREREDPFHWAAFVLQGDWRALPAAAGKQFATDRTEMGTKRRLP